MSESSDEKQPSDNPLWLLVRRYEVPVLAVLVGFMFWVRTQSWDRFVSDGGVTFRGNDPWYHLRETTYVVENWPATMPFDPWTNFPYGTAVDQFGTLFDQLVATAALVIGLGDPSPELIATTLAFAPAAFGALVAIPAYFVGKRLGGRVGGLFGVLVLALLPGTFLQYSLVGFGDHHAAEVFFQAVAVLAVMVALAVVERDKPVYELVVDRDLAALRRPVGWSALAGVAVALYVWTWPPAILLIAVLGIFLVLKIAADYLAGTSPEPVAFAGAVSMGVTGVLTLGSLNAVNFSPTSFGLLQPLVAFGVAGTCVGLAWLAREWDERDLPRRAYPASVFGVVVVGFGLLVVLLPDLFATFQNNFQRFVGFSAGAETRTIGEAQPFLSQIDPRLGVEMRGVIEREYGAMFYTALVGLVALVGTPILRGADRQDVLAFVGGVVVVGAVWLFGVGDLLAGVLPLGIAPVLYETFLVGGTVAALLLRGDHDAERMFVAVWALFIVAAAFTQVRFNYYLALVVVALNAYLVGRVMLLLRIVDRDGDLRTEIEPYQVMALMLALLVVLWGLVFTVPIGQSGQQQLTTNTAIEVGNGTAPGDVTKWNGTLSWMQDDTPRAGTYGGVGDPMEMYGTFDVPPDGDFEYGDGAYGVMSWWDYGHWITVQGERIPNANPFQENAVGAANFLLAPSEGDAEDVLANQSEKGAATRYVAVDWKMVNTDAQQDAKFTAPIVFYDEENVSQSDFLGDAIYQQSPQSGLFPVTQPKKQRYYESMMVRLYKFHGSAVEPKPVVLDWEASQAQDADGNPIDIRVAPQDGPVVRTNFSSMEEARAYVQNDSTSRIGGFANNPQERIPALEHYRLAKASESSAVESQSFVNSVIQKTRGLNVSQEQLLNNQQWVKVFERVDGAEVQGQGPPNTTVTASVEMRMQTTNETFTYHQQAETGPDGEFTMTLPYSTTGYDQWGPEEGYTNVSVRADGSYVFSTPSTSNETGIYAHRDRANVTEAQVIGESDDAVQVELQEETLLEFPDGNETDAGNETETGNETDAGNETETGNESAPGNETDAGNETDDDGRVGPVGPAAAGGDAGESGGPAGPPADPATRAGLVAFVMAGVLLDVRND